MTGFFVRAADCCVGFAAVAMAVASAVGGAGDHELAAGAFRSPVGVAVVGREDLVVTANADSGTASLVDAAAGVVLDEVRVGRGPACVASRGGDDVVVTTLEDGELVLLGVAGDSGRERLVERGRLHLGLEPAGVAVSADGSTACVALSAVDRVAIVDLDVLRLRSEVVVGRLPRFLAFSPDGSTVAVTCSADAGVVLVDPAAGEVVSRHPFKGFNLGQPAFAPDGRTVWFPWTYDGGSHPSPGNIRRGWVTGSRLGRLTLSAASDGAASGGVESGGPQLAGLTLDVAGRAVGDVLGLAVTDGGQTQLVAAGGTHELLRLHEPGQGGESVPYTQISGLEVMDARLAADPSRFARLDLGGRPLGIVIDESRRRGYVANRLLDSVQVIDLDRFQLLATIPLATEAPSAEAALVRQGEAIFYDAQRSLDQWYSCHTCHYEGGGSTVTFDTLNDGSTGSYKTVLPLYGVAHTGPWTWHGWQQDFQASLATSLVETMKGPQPTEEDVAALAAYLQTLTAPPSPHRERDGSLTASAERGRQLFASDRTGCTDCHGGPHFTSEGLHDVGLGRSSDRYEGFSPPSLLGLHRKTRFLHTGKARSLEQVLTKYHAPEQVSGLPPLCEDDVADLVAYLQSL